MKELFDRVSIACSILVTRNYSTSFSLGIFLLNRRFRKPLYSIYGFVRFADEIVDTLHDYNQEDLFKKFREDTVYAIDEKISLNPILNSFQIVVHEYNIEWALVDTFLKSMEMDLVHSKYDRDNFEKYILGSAEVVGLMCLRVFTEGDANLYERLKPAAMKLGAAFQKVNFLRDVRDDFENLGRMYFPGVDLKAFSTADKRRIESEIERDFQEALEGIKLLPRSARRGVYVAYIYYLQLFRKIKSVAPHRILKERIRIHNSVKMSLMVHSLVRHKLNLL